MHSAVYAVVMSVCPSVCHTCVLCWNNRAHHQAIITIAISLGTLVYGYQTYLLRDPLFEALNWKGVLKKTAQGR